MGTEIEKKYRLSEPERAALIKRLGEVDASAEGEVFEENTLYTGGALQLGNRVLRLRRVNGAAILTYKERYASVSAVKHQREDETGVDDADQMAVILEALGFKPAIVYEKWRSTWRINGTEVVIDRLPFGLYAEIEGTEEGIARVEILLGLNNAEPEMSTYPRLATYHGEKKDGRIEARFQDVQQSE